MSRKNRPLIRARRPTAAASGCATSGHLDVVVSARAREVFDVEGLGHFLKNKSGMPQRLREGGEFVSYARETASGRVIEETKTTCVGGRLVTTITGPGGS